jgi:hypothetical protein
VQLPGFCHPRLHPRKIDCFSVSSGVNHRQPASATLSRIPGAPKLSEESRSERQTDQSRRSHRRGCGGMSSSLAMGVSCALREGSQESWASRLF